MVHLSPLFFTSAHPTVEIYQEENFSLFNSLIIKLHSSSNLMTIPTLSLLLNGRISFMLILQDFNPNNGN